MTHRRLILAGCVAAVALGAVWFRSADRLTAEEQRLVGTWLHAEPGPPATTLPLILDADRRCYLRSRGDSQLVGRWSASAGYLTIEGEPTFFGRAVRPLYRLVGRRVREVHIDDVVGADEFVIRDPAGGHSVGTRDFGD